MTTQIIISDISIHQDSKGRYSINDLHKAAGAEHRHLPNYWLELQQTKELIEEILNTGIPVINPPVASRKGRYGGTYVCKELVYSYAMWISAAFALKVIRAYDALVSGNVEVKPKVRQCTATQLTPLRQTAERLITTGLGKIYPDIWKLVHQRFDVEHIHQLQPEQVGEAIEYLNVLEGEYLGRETLPATPSVHFTNEELCALCWVWNAAEYMREKLELAYPAMRTLKSEYAPSFYSMAFEYQRTLEAGRKVLERETKHIVPHPHSVSDENWRRVLPRLRQNSLPRG
ncbi:KilA-N domain-containing protein [Escherichia coli]|uniref:KilA-N domain-containing protein n=1 Tax=Escherichia coli TaxID=562 RepID=UPI00033B0AD5|nr:KilA-N domain-containing protein [Escherichia coli]EHU4305825.1 KilA-N domain-containing protein [Salmonella enterica]HCB1589246.1 KilA-N domain-containing protein [Citrobacter freundii]EEY9908050.1 DNA-binding protein [Escherichia coli]EFH4491941.1 DNA-binding protein [Escherichia coli]EFL4445245.1 DNA-binding protein [Escherichia coli]